MRKRSGLCGIICLTLWFSATVRPFSQPEPRSLTSSCSTEQQTQVAPSLISQMALVFLPTPPLNGIHYKPFGIENWRWFSRLVNTGGARDRAPLQPCLSESVAPPSGWDAECEIGAPTTHQLQPTASFWECPRVHGCQDSGERPSPRSLPLAYWRGLFLSMLLKLWLRRLRLDEPGLLEAPLPAAGTLEGPGNLGIIIEISINSDRCSLHSTTF